MPDIRTIPAGMPALLTFSPAWVSSRTAHQWELPALCDKSLYWAFGFAIGCDNQSAAMRDARSGYGGDAQNRFLPVFGTKKPGKLSLPGK